jgi:hypothetical protein
LPPPSKPLTQREIEEELEYLVNQYRQAMELHNLRASDSFVDVFLISPLEIAEDIVKFKVEQACQGIPFGQKAGGRPARNQDESARSRVRISIRYAEALRSAMLRPVLDQSAIVGESRHSERGRYLVLSVASGVWRSFRQYESRRMRP